MSVIIDPRIDESSSLAISARFPGIAYTTNDEGKPVVYAIDIATGEVVGSTKMQRTRFIDPEAMALDNEGTLWVADIGDNTKRRTCVALYAFPEPGPGKHKLEPTHFPVEYPDRRPRNAETFLLDPTTGRKYLVTKAKKQDGKLFELPAELQANTHNVAVKLGAPMPQRTTDGAISPNGAWAVLTDGHQAYVLETGSWSVVRTFALPPVPQGESLAFAPDGSRFLIGSEGENSPLLWVDFDQTTGAPPA